MGPFDIISVQRNPLAIDKQSIHKTVSNDRYSLAAENEPATNASHRLPVKEKHPTERRYILAKYPNGTYWLYLYQIVSQDGSEDELTLPTLLVRVLTKALHLGVLGTLATTLYFATGKGSHAAKKRRTKWMHTSQSPRCISLNLNLSSGPNTLRPFSHFLHS